MAANVEAKALVLSCAGDAADDVVSFEHRHLGVPCLGEHIGGSQSSWPSPDDDDSVGRGEARDALTRGLLGTCRFGRHLDAVSYQSVEYL